LSHAADERKFVSAARNGDSAAFEILCARSAIMAFRIARRIVATTEAAEDVQDSLQQAFTHFKSFKGDSLFSTWVSRMVTNAALMRLRKNKVRRELSFDELSISQPDFFDVEGQSLNPEQCYARNEQHRVLSNAMSKLTPGLRRVLELREFDERSIEETARMMRISVENVKSRVFRGRRKLCWLLDRPKPGPMCGYDPLRLSRGRNCGGTRVAPFMG
jgi:RNA polymerase sigma-70 factor (ECF subfamily)